jgi:type 1 fimbria pilin
MIRQEIALACGASDADNLVDLTVPSPNAELLQIGATTKTAGTGTGTFGLQVKYGEAAAVAIGAASAVTFIDADAAAGTVHGQFSVKTSVKDQEGKHLNIATVKSGTVSANATLLISLLWRI